MQKPPTLQQQFPDIAAADSTQTTNRSNYTNNLESRKLQNTNLVIIIADITIYIFKMFYLFQYFKTNNNKSRLLMPQKCLPLIIPIGLYLSLYQCQVDCQDMSKSMVILYINL